MLDLVDRPVKVGPRRIGEREHEAGLAGVDVVGFGAWLDALGGRSDQGAGQPSHRLVGVEVQRLGRHPRDRPGAGLGRTEVDRPIDPGRLLGGRQKLLGHQFQPGISHRAAFPGNEDELLPLEILPEKPVGLGFGVSERQPPLHIVAVVALGLDRPH